MRVLDKHIEEIDREAQRYIDDHFDGQRALLHSIRGVGPVTILSVTASLPELGKLNRRAISSGLAWRRWPMTRGSARALDASGAAS